MAVYEFEGKVKLQSVECTLLSCVYFHGVVQLDSTSLVTFLKSLQTASVEKAGQEQDSPGHSKLGARGLSMPLSSEVYNLKTSLLNGSSPSSKRQ